jgi:type IV pilus assembly protein PilO
MSTAAAPSTMRERLSSPLTWHYLGLTMMIVLVLVLGIRLAMDWSATTASSRRALAGEQTELKSLETQTAPLRGLDKRVADSRDQMQSFFEKRIPTSYSSIAGRIGELEVKSGVRLSRVQYSQGDTNGDLTEISMDAGISGEYPQMMRFINGLERDKTFFVIRAMALTGQQGGMVNLRLRVSTWMRPSDVPSGLPPTAPQVPAGKGAESQEGE